MARQSTNTRFNERLNFADGDAFFTEVRQRVNAYFKDSKARKRDCPRMYLKSAIIMAAFAATWVLLVLVASTWWQAIPLAVLMGLVIAGIGFNIEHDGGHNAFSSRRWINRTTALTLDLVGASSYIWRWKHAVQHHTHVNIKGWDSDIELSPFGRVSPHAPHRWYFRWQHLYLWVLYGVLVLKWHVYDDFRCIITGKIGDRPFPRPKGWALAELLLGKAVSFAIFIGIPMIFHPIWVVLVFYVFTFAIVGLLLSVVFQLAHCVETAEFPQPDPEDGSMRNSWAVHQLENTANFARNSRLVTWFLGGLNYQIEHHLFPSICHTNYPAIAAIVRQTCEEFEVKYNEFPTFLAGIASHYRWLKRHGQPA